ncbi:MAG: phospholipase C, phosphocholine-specific, partial [Candidatus Aeolococcus gillhamiae]
MEGRPSRRDVLKAGAGVAAGGALASSGLSPALLRAIAATQATCGTLADVRNVVIFIQENRSFDHYFGRYKGVRGFDDRSVRLSNTDDGTTIFKQSYPIDGIPGAPDPLLPFHINTSEPSTSQGECTNDIGHQWSDQHAMWNDGLMDSWVARYLQSNPGGNGKFAAITMGYYQGSPARDHSGDVDLYWALADNFTVCDNYFCSIKGPTTPNRLYHWTGTIDPSGHAGGPVVGCPSAYPTAKEPKLDWMTYPERLQDQGISWRIYASDEMGSGSSDEDRWVGEFGCNPLWLFKNYQDALTSTLPRDIELVDRASLRTQWQPNSGQGTDPAHVLAKFVADCAPGGNLPKVSWVIAPGGYSEHPKSRPVDGAAFIETMLQGIWADPELWSKTVVLINYDEHDGFFDHVIPPTAPSGAPD